MMNTESGTSVIIYGGDTSPAQRFRAEVAGSPNPVH